MKLWALLLAATGAVACQRGRAVTAKPAHEAAPAAAAASDKPELVAAGGMGVESDADGLYRQAFERAQQEVTASNAWQQLRAMERAIDQELEADTK